MTSVYPFGLLTETEKGLLTAFSRGELVDLTQESPDGAARACLDGTRRVVRASAIRRLLLSDTPVEPGCLRQLHLAGAIVRGPLDLRFAQIGYPVRFVNCIFDSPVRLSEAHLRSVSLHGCHGREVDARHVTVDGDLVLDQVHLRGPLRLSGAHLMDDLHLNRAHISAPRAEAALDLDNIDVKGKIEANDMTVQGAVRMESASVAGTLHMRRTAIDATVPAGPRAGPRPQARQAWYGDGMTVQGEVDASGLRAAGVVQLIAARVLDLVLQDVRIKSTGTALLLDRLEARGTVCCDEGSEVTGGFRAVGIKVGDTFSLRRATMRAVPGKGEKPAAVDLRHAQIAQELLCKPFLHTVGRFDLTGARIGGRANLDGATLQPAEEWDRTRRSLVADHAEITGDLSARDSSVTGVVRLLNAKIGGSLIVGFPQAAKPSVDGGAGPVMDLAAQGVSVTRDVLLGTAGTVDLGGADITGDLTLDLSRLQAPGDDRAAADLAFVTTGVLDLGGAPRRGLVDLTRATVRLLEDDLRDLSATIPAVLDGFEYGDIAGLGNESPPAQAQEQARSRQAVKQSRKAELDARLEWLMAGTRFVRDPRLAGNYAKVDFTPQPYQQLAAVYQRAGQDHEARRVLRTMYQRRNAVKTPPGLAKVWNHVQDRLLGYGYAPGLALGWLLALAVATAGWFQFNTHVGIAKAFLLPLGLVLPGSGYDRLAPWDVHLSIWSHVIAGVLVFSGLLLGATVLAALARFVKR